MSNNSTPMSSILPPPPIFKPTFIQMQKSGSGLSQASIGTLNPNKNSQNSNNNSSNSSSTNNISLNINSNSNNNNNTNNNNNKSDNINGFYSNSYNNNSNYLTSSYVPNKDYNNKLINHSPSISPMTNFADANLGNENPDSKSGILNLNLNSTTNQRSRKRRRSSNLSNKEEIERKKKELKAQHSIIEKKRRIKMNREFEALKFLVPACRSNILIGLNENNFENSNLMHKLTILQSTVEYIKYLHLIIRLLKLQMLIPKNTRKTFKNWFKKNGNLEFVDFDLDLQNYRNIDKEFNFEELFLKIWKNDGEVPSDWLDPITKEITNFLNEDEHREEGGEEEKEDNNDEEDEDEDDGHENRDNEEDESEDQDQDEVDDKKNGNGNLNGKEKEKLKNSFNPYSHLPSFQYRTLSQSSIYQSSSRLLQDKIFDNSSYRKSLFECQNDDPTSFKLPLPAIIDKHTDFISNSSYSNSTTNNLRRHTPSPKHVNVSNSPLSNSSSPSIKVQSQNSSNSSLNSERNSISIPLSNRSSTSSFSSLNQSDYNKNPTDSYQISSNPLPNHMNSDDLKTDKSSTTFNVRAASKLLLSLKSNERRASIESMLN